MCVFYWCAKLQATMYFMRIHRQIERQYDCVTVAFGMVLFICLTIVKYIHQLYLSSSGLICNSVMLKSSVRFQLVSQF